jgi:hypothetical protein
MLNGYAVCKNCGNGTMNNRINEQFVLTTDHNDNEVVMCSVCGTSHIDGELYKDDSEDLNNEARLDQEDDAEDEILAALHSDPFSDEPFEREVGA